MNNRYTMSQFHYSILLTSVASLFIACSGIDEDNRLIYEQLPLASHAVLIEDFTGQRCINCPTGAAEVQRLKEEYGADTIISVAIHAGPLAVFPTSRVNGLRTTTGDEYAERFGIGNVMPAAQINRSIVSTNINEWGTLVRQAIQQTSPARLTASAMYEEPSRTATVIVNVQALQTLDSRLQVWLTESGITALQYMPDGTLNNEYQHNHVLRAAVNGTWGQDFQLNEGDTIAFSYKIPIDETWQAEKIAFVTFVYDGSGVQQVIETPMLTSNKSIN